MSDFVIDDWKLKARTVVKLYRKNTSKLVFLLVKDDVLHCLNVSFNLHCTEMKDVQRTKW